MRIAILCNGRDLGLWQRQAIARLGPDHEFSLLVAREPAPERRKLRHLAYYALNLLAIRNRLTRRVPFPDSDQSIVARHDFAPITDGRWASFTPAVLDWLADRRIDCVVKFGLGLLRVPSPEQLAAPILSFHHGDPRSFRGRPAGFYELLTGARYQGQVVQCLGNRLDAGEVLAFAESRVVPHSYKGTLLEAYALSPFLLPKALAALASGARVAMPTQGTNYRLPGNFTVVALVLRMLRALVARLAYGLFVEKKWRVARLDIAADTPDPAAAMATADQHQSDWLVPPIPPGYNFLADGFFAPSGELLVEALHRRSGKGQLMRLGADGATALTGTNGHASYPAPFHWHGADYIVPEISGWSAPALFQIDGDALVRVADLDMEAGRLLDPTMLAHEGRVYLFANLAADGASVLHLWSAPDPFGRFERHPASPIRLSVRGSRMAGGIQHWNGQLFRIGQDWCDGYGHGILAFAIETLTPNDYRESRPIEAAFSFCRGPHTVHRRGNEILFDFYHDRFAPLAGVRRILSRV